MGDDSESGGGIGGNDEFFEDVSGELYGGEAFDETFEEFKCDGAKAGISGGVLEEPGGLPFGGNMVSAHFDKLEVDGVATESVSDGHHDDASGAVSQGLGQGTHGESIKVESGVLSEPVMEEGVDGLSVIWGGGLFAVGFSFYGHKSSIGGVASVDGEEFASWPILERDALDGKKGGGFLKDALEKVFFGLESGGGGLGEADESTEPGVARFARLGVLADVFGGFFDLEFKLFSFFEELLGEGGPLALGIVVGEGAEQGGPQGP